MKLLKLTLALICAAPALVTGMDENLPREPVVQVEPKVPIFHLSNTIKAEDANSVSSTDSVMSVTNSLPSVPSLPSRDEEPPSDQVTGDELESFRRRKPTTSWFRGKLSSWKSSIEDTISGWRSSTPSEEAMPQQAPSQPVKTDKKKPTGRVRSKTSNTHRRLTKSGKQPKHRQNSLEKMLGEVKGPEDEWLLSQIKVLQRYLQVKKIDLNHEKLDLSLIGDLIKLDDAMTKHAYIKSGLNDHLLILVTPEEADRLTLAGHHEIENVKNIRKALSTERIKDIQLELGLGEELEKVITAKNELQEAKNEGGSIAKWKRSDTNFFGKRSKIKDASVALKRQNYEIVTKHQMLKEAEANTGLVAFEMWRLTYDGIYGNVGSNKDRKAFNLGPLLELRTDTNEGSKRYGFFDVFAYGDNEPLSESDLDCSQAAVERRDIFDEVYSQKAKDMAYIFNKEIRQCSTKEEQLLRLIQWYKARGVKLDE